MDLAILDVPVFQQDIFDITRGSLCQAPLCCCFHATAAAAAVLLGPAYKNSHGELVCFLCSPPPVVALSWLWSSRHGYGGRSALMSIVPCLSLVRLLQSVLA